MRGSPAKQQAQTTERLACETTDVPSHSVGNGVFKAELKAGLQTFLWQQISNRLFKSAEVQGVRVKVLTRPEDSGEGDTLRAQDHHGG